MSQYQQSSCDGKSSYKSMKIAKKVIKHSDIQDRRISYLCQFCHLYHIGSTVKPKRKMKVFCTEDD